MYDFKYFTDGSLMPLKSLPEHIKKSCGTKHMDEYWLGGYASLILDNCYQLSKFICGSFKTHKSTDTEIKAVIEAINHAMDNDAKRIKIYFDCDLIYSSLFKVTHDEKVNEYKEKYFHAISNGIIIDMEKVKAHSNNKFNDLADKIAKKSIMKFITEVKYFGESYRMFNNYEEFNTTLY